MQVVKNKTHHANGAVHTRSLRDNRIFVGRHKAIYDYCLEQGYIDKDTPSFFNGKLPQRVALRHIKDKDVIGTLSLELAAFTKSYTEIPLHNVHVTKGLELDIEDVRLGAGMPRKYQIRRI